MASLIEDLSDVELREQLKAFGFDIPVSLNRDFLLKKLRSCQSSGQGAPKSPPARRKSPGRNSLAPASPPKPPRKSTNEGSGAGGRRKSEGRTKSPGRNGRESLGGDGDNSALHSPHFASTPNNASPKAKKKLTLGDAAAFARTNENHEEENSFRTPRRSTRHSMFETPAGEDAELKEKSAEKARFSAYLSYFKNEGDSPSSPALAASSSSAGLSGGLGGMSGGLLGGLAGTPTGRSNRRWTEAPAPIDTSAALRRRSGGISSSPNGHSNLPRLDRFDSLANTKRRGEESTGVLESSPFASKFLLVTFVGFLCVIGMAYYAKVHNGPNLIEEPAAAIVKVDGIYSICGDEGIDEVACVPSANLKTAKNLFGLLKDELRYRGERRSCGAPEGEEKLSLGEAKSLLFALSDEGTAAVNGAFTSFLVLATNNPKWGLTIDDGAAAVRNSRDVLLLDHAKARIFLTEPIQPSLLCIIQLAITSVANYIAIVAGVGTLSYFVFRGGAYYFAEKRRKEAEVFEVVEQILELLQRHYESAKATGGDNFLAVAHIRDEMFPPAERSGKTQLWDRVVAYIVENESRVREEIQHISGEEFRVWRWLPAASPLTRKSMSPGQVAQQPPTDPDNKWQGQAFEMSEGSPNALPSIPTNCLKIRQMFNPTTGCDKGKIERAILKKCEDSRGILHIGVDSDSSEGCVYIRCNSKADARTVYLALHGWWFDGNLLSVKFLKEERYFHRFPEAKTRRL